MLNDQRLEELLRSANEVERMERGRANRLLHSRAGLAAAGLVIATITAALLLYTRPPRLAQVPPTIDTPTGPVVAEKHGSVVMAVAEDGEGKLKCVKWSANAFGGKTLEEVASNDLARAGLALACDPDTVRMLVVGMQGPAARLPDSDRRATEIAECILKTPSCGVGAFDSHSCAQAGCAGGDVKVRVETIALK